MIRWSSTSGTMGQFESLLVGLDADGRDQALTLWTQDQARRIARAARRRDARHNQRVKNLCWGIVSGVLLLAAMSLGNALDMEKPQTIGQWHGARVIEQGGAR
jgi:hypothetical protein